MGKESAKKDIDQIRMKPIVVVSTPDPELVSRQDNFGFLKGLLRGLKERPHRGRVPGFKHQGLALSPCCAISRTLLRRIL
jgi:hypothetical protein